MKNLFRSGVKLKPITCRSESVGNQSSMSVTSSSNDLQSILQRGLFNKSLANIGYSDDDTDNDELKESDSEWP